MASFSVFQIPTAGVSPWYTQATTLSGTRYTFEFRFNTRAGMWFMDVLNAAAAPIVLGIPMLIERSLTSQYGTLSLPPGQLLVLDNSGLEQQPGLGSFLKDHGLYYGVTQ